MAKMSLDPEQIVRTKSVFQQQSTAVTELMSKLSNEVQNNIGPGRPAWEGPRADTFVNAWKSEFEPVLKNLVTALDGAGQELQKALNDAQAALG